MHTASMPAPAWWGWLVGVVVVGLAVRAVYVLVVLEPVRPGLDAIWYQLQGSSIRNGNGFVVPTTLFEARQVPTAGFPPAYPLYQAAWQSILGAGPTSVRLAGLVPASFTIALAGLLGRDLVGPRAGLAVAGIVAVDPTLISVDGSTMSENLTVPLVVVIVMIAVRRVKAVDRTAFGGAADLGWVLLLGVACGAAVLTRQDLVLLVPLVAVPSVVWRSGRSWARAAGLTAMVIATAAAVVVPWAWRNHRQVGSFAVSTLSPSSAAAGANCDATYRGDSLGSWSFPCVAAATPSGPADEVEVADAQRSAATGYVGRHLIRVPLVVAAREARVWGWWDPRDLARRDAEESRRYGWQLVSRPFDAVLFVTGAVGLAVWARRRRLDPRALITFGPLLLVVLSAAFSYGNPRFNAIAHPVLILGVVAAWGPRRAQSAARGRANREPWAKLAQ